jgi:hypothetical protein
MHVTKTVEGNGSKEKSFRSISHMHLACVDDIDSSRDLTRNLLTRNLDVIYLADSPFL